MITCQQTYKQQLNESMSSIAYHFCPIDALWAILKSKTFKLTSVQDTSAEDREKCTIGSRVYPYYMCFSRSHSCLHGYVRRRLEGDATWRKGIVRITVDGNKFNNNFKTVPVNVYSDVNDERVAKKFNKTISKENNPKTKWFRIEDYLEEKELALKKGIKKFPTFEQWKSQENKKLGDSMGIFTFKKGDKNSGTLNRELTASLNKNSQFKQMLEFEDRLLSDKREIPAFPYIKRIDILLTETGMKDINMVQMVGDILLRYNYYVDNGSRRNGFRSNTYRKFKLPIHVYDTISSFETNADETNPKSIILYSEKFGNINKNFLRDNASIVSKSFEPLLTTNQLNIIAIAISALISIECRSEMEFKNLAKSLIRNYGLNDGNINGVSYEEIIMNKLYFFNMSVSEQIRARSTWKTTRDTLRANFTGELQRYANAIRRMYDDFMTANNWKFKTFGQFQSGLNNRYKDYTGKMLPQTKYREMTKDESFIEEMSRYGVYIGDKVMSVLFVMNDEGLGIPDEYVVNNIKLSYAWDIGLEKIYGFYKKHGYVDAYLENFVGLLWKKYKKVARPYKGGK